MLRKVLAITTIAALAAASSAFAAKGITVQEIDAQVDLTALENTSAAARYATIEGDLESALAALLVDQLADVGVRIVIDISEVELSNSFQETMNIADTHLVGNVKVIDDVDAGKTEVYEMTVNVEQAKMYFPEGVEVVTLTTSSDTYYDAMIEAFAQGVADRLMN